MTTIDQQNFRYIAYLNYLLAAQRLVEHLYPTKSDLVKHLVNSRGYQRLTGYPTGDKGRVVELLHNSWFTQILLEETRQYPTLIPLNSPWSLVQSYYAIFSIGRAYFLSQGRIVNPKHAETLSALAGDLEIPNSRFPMPWNCVYSGDPESNSLYLINAPAGKIITLTNPLCSPYTNDSWQHYGLFLKTTRKKQIKASIDGWKAREKRVRILKPERQTLLASLRPTSIFDALYRLRIRSNYQDIDSFAFGVSRFGLSDDDVTKFYDAILSFTDYTLLVFEVLIAKALGKHWLINEIDSFASSSFVLPKKQRLIDRRTIISHFA